MSLFKVVHNIFSYFFVHLFLFITENYLGYNYFFPQSKCSPHVKFLFGEYKFWANVATGIFGFSNSVSIKPK